MRMPMIVSVVCWTSLAVSPGCTHITHQPVPFGDMTADREARGIRYYRSSLYLLVHSDGHGGVVSRIIELPDVTQKMSAETGGILGSADWTLALRDGALTDTREELHNDVVARALLDAAGGVIQSAAKAMYRRSGSGALEHALPPPSLFKILVHGDEIEFVGAEGDEPVRVKLPAGRSA